MHRYDRRMYPKSRLPGVAVYAFEAQLAHELACGVADDLAVDVEVGIGGQVTGGQCRSVVAEEVTVRVSYDAVTVRGEG